MLEEPCSEYGDCALGQSPLRPPSIMLDHAELLERPLLPEVVVDEPEPRPDGLAPSGAKAILFPQALARRPDLARDCVSQAPELLGDRLQGEGRVGPRGPEPSHGLERGDHNLHLLVVLPVPLFNLSSSKEEEEEGGRERED